MDRSFNVHKLSKNNGTCAVWGVVKTLLFDE